jgi:hypothetical protein
VAMVGRTMRPVGYEANRQHGIIFDYGDTMSFPMVIAVPRSWPSVFDRLCRSDRVKITVSLAWTASTHRQRVFEVSRIIHKHKHKNPSASNEPKS